MIIMNPALRDQIEKQRRSKRLPLRIPVRVYGRTPEDQPFRDVTETELVSAHGGLLPLAPNVTPGQTILLVNSLTEEERECVVLYVEPDHGNKNRVGIKFAEPRDNFWHAYTPLKPPQQGQE